MTKQSKYIKLPQTIHLRQFNIVDNLKGPGFLALQY